MRRLLTLTLLTVLLVVGIELPQAIGVSALGHSGSAPAKKVCKTKKVHGKKKKNCTTAKPKPTPTPTPTLSFTQQVDDALTADHFSGSILLEKGGQILFEKSYGMADRASNTPNTPQTKIPIFGINFSLAAVGIMKLQEEGKLSVQDKLCAYLASCPAAWQPITLEELLLQTSEIPDYSDWTSSTGGTDSTLAACLAQSLWTSPGTLYVESGCNIFLVNTVIEKVSGKSWSDFMQQTIFGPAGMTSSGRMTNSRPPPQRARGYVGSDPGQEANYNSYYEGYSTLEDLYRFDMALLAGKIISQQSLAAMFTPGPQFDTAPEGSAIYAAHGFREIKGTTTPPPGWTRPMELEVGSLGGFDTLGFSITNWFSPDDGAVLLLLNNDVGAVNGNEETNLRANLLRPGLFGKP
jgi:CubicO group peptidase (beta-lactamase class C family)